MWLLAPVALALGVAGCGGGSSIPANAVAVVDGIPISKASYDRYALILSRSGAPGGKAQQSSQQKTAAFITTFQKRWRALTTCRQGYIVLLCSNAPTPKTTSTKTG